MTRTWEGAQRRLFPLLCLFQVTAEELSGNDDYVELSFSARKLDDKVPLPLFTLVKVPSLVQLLFRHVCQGVCVHACACVSWRGLCSHSTSPIWHQGSPA